MASSTIPAALLKLIDSDNQEQRTALRYLCRLWDDDHLIGILQDTSMKDLLSMASKATTRVVALHRNAPRKWPLDSAAVHPKVQEIFVELFPINEDAFEVCRALAVQMILNRRKTGKISPRKRD